MCSSDLAPDSSPALPVAVFSTLVVEATADVILDFIRIVGHRIAEMSFDESAIPREMTVDP